MVVALPVLTAGSCDCNSLCDDPGERIDFTGELESKESGIAVFRGPDGPIRVAISHNLSFLDVGTTYQVRAVADRFVTAPWTSQVNARCGGPCDDINVLHADGASIDTGWWTGFNRSYPVTEAVWLFLAIPIITLVAVSANRLRRGGDHDPYVDLPDDGSWIEYDGYVDDEGDPA